MFNWKLSVFMCICVLTFNITSGWKWTTSDAIIQDGWPEESALAIFKRASISSSSTSSESTTIADTEEDEGMLVFEGRYFTPNEVPPPPPFMVANNNWRGKFSPKKPKHKQPKSKSSSVNDAPAKENSGVKPLAEKFTEENAKVFEENGKSQEEERISSSNSKNVITSLPSKLEDHEEYATPEDAFPNAPKCFTTTDVAGRCVPFKQCYPVVFNVIDGELRNPGLAKLLYQSSGPCNATLELDFALNQLKNHKAFLNPKFYNQSICCPGFKHPPTMMRPWEEDVKNIRLTSYENSDGASVSKPNDEYPSEKLETVHNIQTTIDDKGSREVLGVEESSVEISEDSPHVDAGDGETDKDELLNDATEEATVGSNIAKENSTVEVALSDDSTSVEARRGDRDENEKPTSSADAFLSIPSPDLSPNSCRHQIYGMPRGHWPWMVAIVISSRHICSGALINARYVVSAAHCVHLLDESDILKLRIIIGDRVMYSAIDGPHFWRKVTKVITHVNYNQQTFASDIAILKMNSDVPFSRNVQPISLPNLKTPVGVNAFDKGIVAGWSGADIGNPAFEARMEIETVVDIMDKNECQEAYRGFALSGVATNTFCIKATNFTCVADSGGPLFVRVQNCWILAGIMSWGIGCSHFPEVYTDVTRYTSWIRSHAV